MPERKNRYAQMERFMTRVLLGDLAVFVLFLISAAFGIIWLKVITAIIAILVSGLCLVYLYLSQELTKKRSLWMSVSAGAVLICLLASLILNFPSPNPFKDLPIATSVSQNEQ